MNTAKLVSRYRQLTLESEDHWDYRGRVKSEKDYVHGLCTYPAMMVPKMQREMLDVYLDETEKEDIYILDPFAGAGTILVESMLRGLNIVGIDINPLAVLLCKAKTTILQPDLLREKADKVFESVRESKGAELFLFDGVHKWFTDKAIEDLSVIRSSIMSEPDIEVRRFFWAAFCEIVRLVSNSRNCTYKLHIKEENEIDSYDKDACELFEGVLKQNVEHYIMFYRTLKEKNLLSEDGQRYKYKLDVILGDSTECLNQMEEKFDLVFTSPPYGDNHTTVSYGQYSILPLRWINYADIDNNVDVELLNTQCAIDNISLGGKKNKSSNKLEEIRSKSATLSSQIDDIMEAAPAQVSKIVAFYDDFDRFLSALVRRMQPDAISVWTVGNRQVAKQEIRMDKILAELGSRYGLRVLTQFTRKIPKKRMPEVNAHYGNTKGKQETMTREHILIFTGGGLKDGGITDAV